MPRRVLLTYDESADRIYERFDEGSETGWYRNSAAGHSFSYWLGPVTVEFAPSVQHTGELHTPWSVATSPDGRSAPGRSNCSDPEVSPSCDTATGHQDSHTMAEHNHNSGMNAQRAGCSGSCTSAS